MITGQTAILNYEEFREQFEKQHPASVPIPPTEVRSEYPRWLRGVVLLMFICAALLSGVHTVPTVYAGIEDGGVVAPLVRAIVALSSFVAVELAIFVAAYARLKANGWLVFSMLVVTFSIALVSNIQSVLKALGANGELGLTVVGVALGIGAPLIALMSGEMFVHMHSASTRADADAALRYREERKLFDTVVLSAYRKYEKDASVRVLSAQTDSRQTAQLSASVLSDQTGNRQTLPAASGYERTPDGQRRVIDFLTEFPDAAQMPSRQLAARIEEVTGVRIGHDTANKGRNAWVELRSSVNGHVTEAQS